MTSPRGLAAWRAYFIPGTEVFKNKLGAADSKTLEEAERKITALALPSLEASPPPLTPEGHREAHLRLFGEVYPWAGRYRDVALTKEATHFAAPERIASALEASYAGLRAEGHLIGTDRERFVDRASVYFAQWNLVHPFREGNGRAQRIMLQALGREAGHPLDFRSISAERMVQASVESSDLRAPKLGRLRGILREATDPDRLAVFDRMRPALEALRRDGHFDWNGADIAVARRGERLEGVAALPREDERVFLIRAGGRLVITTPNPGQPMPAVGARVSHVEALSRDEPARATSRRSPSRTEIPERETGRSPEAGIPPAQRADHER